MPGAGETEGRRVGLLAYAPWIVIVVGAAVMMVLFVIAAAAFSGIRTGSGRPAAGPELPSAMSPLATEEDPAVGADGDPPSPDGSGGSAAPASTGAGTGAAPAATSRAPRPASPSASPRAGTASPPATAQPSVLAGSYRVREGWPGLSAGELTVDNPSGTAQPWTATLSFPDRAGELRAYWVDGVPQPTLRRSGGRYVFTGAIPLGARASLRLQLQFHHSNGPARPAECSVNGASCTVH
ncbi:hypothetical protein [Plantactinospora sp. KBS50]|uniref:hypothetical protein n=1 Tax=Plantactinospora sp. KBS50 TaxID=2024580 RepID=UPI0012FD20A8|nr:hypothetical protein [Plantactinospora sp. KBS50]